MTKRETADQDVDFGALEAFFDAARLRAPQPSDDMMARVLADAEAARRPDRGAIWATPAPAPMGGLMAGGLVGGASGGLWDRILDLLGGRGALAGLATAALAGVWIGVVQPAPVAGLALALGTVVASADTVELLPSLDDYLVEN